MVVARLHRPALVAIGLVLAATTAGCSGDAPASAPALRPTTQDEAAPRVEPVGVPGRWRLIFRDEFRGNALDLGTWRPNWLAGSDHEVTKPVNSAELAAYDPRQVEVTQGALHLTAVQQETTDNAGRTYDYASGLVESSHDFRFRYGYAEARIFLEANTDPSLGRVGSCAPNWPAFWLNGERNPRDGEIDVMECLSGDNVAWHYHWARGSAGRSPGRWDGRMPDGGGWHTFGVRWERGRLTFFYDGRKVGTHTRGVARSPHYLVLNNAISGTAIKAPSTLKVDYVRVWKPKR